MHIIRDLNVPDNADLAGKGTALAGVCAAGNANTGGNRCTLANARTGFNHRLRSDRRVGGHVGGGVDHRARLIIGVPAQLAVTAVRQFSQCRSHLPPVYCLPSFFSTFSVMSMLSLAYTVPSCRTRSYFSCFAIYRIALRTTCCHTGSSSLRRWL